mmetsp:Transcript_47753/g.144416  ORF Transcript_47753/g.144416 Transcript_47753/m.144416 type:complete len:81 (-) Transcript_47753:1649-1891(-)
MYRLDPSATVVPAAVKIDDQLPFERFFDQMQDGACRGITKGWCREKIGMSECKKISAWENNQLLLEITLFQQHNKSHPNA